MAQLTVNEGQSGDGGKRRLSQRRAARILGVSFEHLNRVLRGHRQSPPLLARYEALQREEAKRMSEPANSRFYQRLAPAPRRAAEPGGATLSTRSADGAPDNLHPECGELIGRTGFTAVVVSIPSDSLFEPQGFEETLGAELIEAKLGQYDSTILDNPRLHFFLLDPKALRAGLELIQSRLAALDLLTGCKIDWFDTADKTWRTVLSGVEAITAPCPAPSRGAGPALAGSDSPDTPALAAIPAIQEGFAVAVEASSICPP
jgi:transcriptional regulator with XRE-family HTH domain